MSSVSSHHFLKLLATFVLASLLLGSGSWAQTGVPNDRSAAEETIRQKDRERALREQLERQPDIHLPRTKDEGIVRLPVGESPCFPIWNIELVGDSAQAFQWALTAVDAPDDPALGRCLGTQGINLVMKRIQNAVIGKGYVTTRILAAPQDLTSGKLVLTLVPGRVRDIRLAAETTDSRATLWNSVPARPGDMLNLRDVEQGLENLKRLPSAETDIQIVPANAEGAAPGESDLLVKWQQAMPLRISLSLDDSGSRTTGKNQSGFTVSLDHPLALNDLAYLTWNQDLGDSRPGPRGGHGYVAHYSVPFGYWQLGFTASENAYFQSVAGASQTYRYSGESANTEAKISRVVHRTDAGKTALYVKAWTKTSKNFINDTEVLVQRRRMGGWESGIGLQRGLGRANAEVNLNYRRGTGAFGSRHAPEEAFNEGTAQPSFFTADAQLSLPLSLAKQSLRYRCALRAQWERSRLIPQDRFSIGGRYSVRGFNGENTLASERGWTIRNDLGVSMGDLLPEFYLALDHGEVGGPSSRHLVGKRLTGAAIGWRGTIKSLSYDFFVGQPVARPNHFVAPTTTTGFSLAWTL